MKKIILNLIILFNFNCATKNTHNVKELVIGCFPRYSKTISRKDNHMIVHQHEKNGQETMNSHLLYHNDTDNNDYHIDPAQFQNLTISQKPDNVSWPTYLKNILNIQTENESASNYMPSNTFNTIYLEGVPNVDSIDIAHINIFKMLKKGGKLYIQRSSNHFDYIISNQKAIGPFIWQGDMISIEINNSLEFIIKSPNVKRKDSKNICSSITNVFKNFIAQPVYNAFNYYLPSINIRNMHCYFVKINKGEFFEGGISPFLFAISDWLSDVEEQTYELSNITLKEHILNSEKLIKEHFQNIGYSDCQFKYSAKNSKSEYGYEIIITK